MAAMGGITRIEASDMMWAHNATNAMTYGSAQPGARPNVDLTRTINNPVRSATPTANNKVTTTPKGGNPMKFWTAVVMSHTMPSPVKSPLTKVGVSAPGSVVLT